MRDLKSNISIAQALPPATYDADNSPVAIDLQGFDSAVLVLHVGAGGITFTGTNKIEFKLTHSDDDSTYSAVTISDVQGLDSVGSGGIVKAITSAHASADVTKIGYVGGRRYLKLLADFGGTHSAGTPISSVVIKGNPTISPVS